jgi:hypothetical protein
MDKRTDIVQLGQRRAYEGYSEAELGREKFIFGREFPRAVVTHSNLSVIGNLWMTAPRSSLLILFSQRSSNKKTVEVSSSEPHQHGRGLFLYG